MATQDGFKNLLHPELTSINTMLDDLQKRVSALEQKGQTQSSRRLACNELVVGEREDKCLQSYDTWLAFWRARVNLSVSRGMEGPNHNARLIFWDQNKSERLRLGLDEHGNPMLVMLDAKEREIWRMPPEAPRMLKDRGKKKPA